MTEINKVYLAGPFFNDTQLNVVEKIKKILDSLGIKYYSPKDELRFRKEDPPEKAKECFDSNLKAMTDSDFMIAIIDDFDPGTIFEMGYFCCQNKRILAYSDVPGRGLNLMLSQSCVGFANRLRELADILVKINSNNYTKKEFSGEQI